VLDDGATEKGHPRSNQRIGVATGSGHSPFAGTLLFEHAEHPGAMPGRLVRPLAGIIGGGCMQRNSRTANLGRPFPGQCRPGRSWDQGGHISDGDSFLESGHTASLFQVRELRGDAMKFPRRRFLHLAANAVALPAMSRIARAQTYPSRTVTMIVPFAAGEPTDVSARIVAERMSRTLGQQIIIENVLGAGGTTGSIRAMRANPDGYTIEMGQLGTHAASVAFYPNLAYRPEADFAYIGLAVDQAVLIVARRDFPPNDLKEFVAHVKANSDKLNMAHAGVGSITHFTCLLLNSLIGANPAMIPFNGSAPAINALVAGERRSRLHRPKARRQRPR
jgi:hypothetical protein